MPKFKHPIKTKWIKVTTTPSRLIAISDVYQWNCHWPKGARRSFRCTGNDCPLCEKGDIPSERYVMLVEDEKGKAWFLELRERHRETLEEWARYSETVCGVRFIARKRDEYRSAPVDLTWVEKEERKEIYIGRFVEALGADPRAYIVLGPESA